ncbi:MAG TPA: FmdB family zinc ribbon protein [Candidatus Baltobacteraceae bacterium]
MPLYDYRCTTCNNVTEVRHGFDDVHKEPCPACGGALSRVFNPAPIVFKGSGFYVTDSRKSGEAKSPAATPPPPSGAPAAALPAAPAPAAASTSSKESAA